MSLDMKAIGTRIRNQREFLGYSREQLVEIIDITPKFCSDIELGVKGMSLGTLDTLCHSLKLSADYILYGKAVGDKTQSANIIFEMLASCRSDKIGYAVEAMKNIVLAIELSVAICYNGINRFSEPLRNVGFAAYGEVHYVSVLLSSHRIAGGQGAFYCSIQ